MCDIHTVHVFNISLIFQFFPPSHHPPVNHLSVRQERKRKNDTLSHSLSVYVFVSVSKLMWDINTPAFTSTTFSLKSFWSVFKWFSYFSHSLFCLNIFGYFIRFWFGHECLSHGCVSILDLFFVIVIVVLESILSINFFLCCFLPRNAVK